MKGASMPHRGEVYLLDFAPSTGHEMTGLHPCLIVQNDVGNQHSALTIVAAITSNLRAASLPIGVFVPAGTGGLLKDSVVNCGHIYTIDKQRLGKCLGSLPANLMDQINQALVISFAIP